MRTDLAEVPIPAPLGLLLGLWRYLRFGSRRRKRTLDTLSDHLLADVGLNGPGYEQATWQRYIHR